MKYFQPCLLTGATMGEYGKRLRECRIAAGLKQDAAARALGITQSAISQFERDRIEPTIDIAVAMARVYGCTIDYLLGVTDEVS